MGQRGKSRLAVGAGTPGGPAKEGELVQPRGVAREGVRAALAVRRRQQAGTGRQAEAGRTCSVNADVCFVTRKLVRLVK